MRIRNVSTVIIAIALQFQWVSGLFDPITITLGAASAGLAGLGYQHVKCNFYECCNDRWIPVNMTYLQEELVAKLHGQHIARDVIMRTMNGYKSAQAPQKALAISFHGSPGTGKNFVTRILTSAIYKKGLLSDFFHYFSGSTFSASRLEEHKNLVKGVIIDSLLKCERSMFVFDEVDMMPTGLLDILRPFLDYVQPIFVEHESKRIRVNGNKAIFVFLSNADKTLLLDQMVEYWKAGKDRDSLRLQDFENSISSSVLEEDGGFFNSLTIKSSLIDYYVPFLPLEEIHVRLCMRDAFAAGNYARRPTKKMIEEVMSIVTYEPHPYNIYSKNGCKRIEQKVISAVHSYEFAGDAM